VVYRVAPLSYVVGRALVKLEHFSLVNLLAGRTVVPELLQGAFTADAVARHVETLWAGPEREAQLRGLSEVREKLGGPGAAARAAEAVLELLPPTG
jgi:lipid-A-disaccharide synthase